jgi:thymidylate synthase
MNRIISIQAENFQQAWANAVLELEKNKWSVWDLIVQIEKPIIIDEVKHKRMEDFARGKRLIGQNQVAYTIFPYKLYKGRSREAFYKSYWKYYKSVNLNKYARWGDTYFARMIRYEGSGAEIDQLGTIVDSINKRKVNCGASYVMVIPYPQKDIKRKMGAPCLNYVTVQVEKIDEIRYINLCAVYRNHNFRERAYGNYYGLGKLIEYIALETNSEIGNLTCVSSHAYIDNNKAELVKIAEDFNK